MEQMTVYNDRHQYEIHLLRQLQSNFFTCEVANSLCSVACSLLITHAHILQAGNLECQSSLNHRDAHYAKDIFYTLE